MSADTMHALPAPPGADNPPKRSKFTYKVGETMENGAVIRQIVGCSDNFIVFLGGFERLGWDLEAGVADLRHLIALNQVLDEGYTELPPRRYREFSEMAGAAFVGVLNLSGHNAPDPDDVFGQSRRYIAQHRGELAEVLDAGGDFSIYRKRDGDVEWFYPLIPAHLLAAVELFIGLKSVARNNLSEPGRGAALAMLAHSLGAVFRRANADSDSINGSFAGVRKFIELRVAAGFRLTYFLWLGSVTAICLSVVSLLYYFVLAGSAWLIAFGAGMTGAMVSALQRNNESSIDPFASQVGVFAECISRLVIGAIFGCLVMALAQSELAMAPFKANMMALLVFGFVAGFSERFVPDILGTIASKANGQT